MKNPSHFVTTMSRTNKKVTMGTKKGFDIIDLAKKLAFYIDVTRVFENEELLQKTKLIPQKIQNKTASDEDFLMLHSGAFYRPKIWETAVCVGMDTVAYLACIIFFIDNRTTNKTNKCVDLLRDEDGSLDKFQNLKSRSIDMRIPRIYNEETRYFASALANIFERRMFNFGRKFCFHMDGLLKTIASKVGPLEIAEGPGADESDSKTSLRTP